jgi:hypothetical protein
MGVRRTVLGMLCAGLVALGAGAAPAQAEPPDPYFTLFPDFEGPCGLAVDGSGNYYASDYYRHAIDVVEARPGPPFAIPTESPFLHLTTIFNIDPLDGPCGLAVDATGKLYVNNYHRNVEKFTPSSFPLSKSTTYTSAGIVDSSHPTGVAVDFASGNVYVNARTNLNAYDPTGAPLLDGGDSLKIGLGSLGDGYGLAISRFPATLGRIYVPDHSDDTVKVYDPLIDKDDPVQTIDGDDTPNGGFGSLRDSAVAVDRVTGEIYVADTLAYPQYRERPEATIYVFDATGTYKGRLKYNLVDGSPSGLAVDNSTKITQGRVYVTSGNSVQPTLYVYPPGSATEESFPASFSLSVSASGGGEGSLVSTVAGIDCDASCEAQVRAGAQVSLTATPDEHSAFTGWSGSGCSGTGTCTVTMSQARTVSASFEELAGPPASSSPSPSESVAPPPTSPRLTATQTVITQKGTLRVAVSGKMAPKRLPRNGAAPISVSVGGQISTTDRSLPPQLKSMRIELNKEGRLDSTGLPPCNYNAIQPGSSSRALSACKDSLVGEGSFTANITLAGQEAYPTKGKLLVFHSVEKGKPVLYGHIYSPKPFATSFVIVFRVQKLGKGTYGTALDAPLPAAMDAWGRLTSLEMTLSKRYSYRGKQRSFISAGCPAPKGFPGATFPLARTEFSFDGGKKLSSVLSSSCKARG